MNIERERGIEQLISLPMSDLVDIYSKLNPVSTENAPTWIVDDSWQHDDIFKANDWVEEYIPVIKAGIAGAKDTESTVREMVRDGNGAHEDWLVFSELYLLAKIWDAEGYFWYTRHGQIKAEDPLSGHLAEVRQNLLVASEKAARLYMVADVVNGSRSKEIHELVINRLLLSGYTQEAQQLVDILE